MDGGGHLSGEAPFVSESGSSVLAANLEMTCRGSPRCWADVGRTSRGALGSESSTARPYLKSLLGRPPARHAGRRDADAPRFSTGTCGLCGLWLFLLNDSEEVRSGKHAMDVELIMRTIGVMGCPR
jgi:hypothetical protein